MPNDVIDDIIMRFIDEDRINFDMFFGKIQNFVKNYEELVADK